MGLNMGFDKGLDQCIIEAVDRLKDEMIDSILELVRIDSVEGDGSKEAPFGPGVKQALLSALDISRRLGFDTVNLDNYIGYAQYGGERTDTSAPSGMWMWCRRGRDGNSLL